ncbi:hypothetical protein IQ277_21035 [Nostocales cyanobacterium LEGE 12452]|nr:hypothetical protein [Nostocales cyanobacterium LEGE 12452]
MATFRTIVTAEFKFTFINHTNQHPIRYKLGPATDGDQTEHGKVEAGDTVELTSFYQEGTLEQGNVHVVKLPSAPDPGFRFWSGSDGQYINAIGGNGYTVTQDNSEISEITGHGFRITVDGGGATDPSTLNIHFQVYDA